ncbi:MAG TPA: hypothetical protein VF604_20880 [Pyrinomonadaceae bacterium]|jgi:hypothetical protein
MKKILTSSMIAVFAMFLIILSADVASAQPNWARRYNRASVDGMIRRLENSTDAFMRELDRALDRGRMDGTRREDNLMRQASALEAAADELRREYDRRDSWWENRDEVSRCLTAARNLNRLMRDRRLNNMTRNSWARVQTELNSLARVYNLPRV